jgi:hypothetical protein
MHLCMQNDQIGPKFTGSAPADIARLPHLIMQKIVFRSKQPSPSAGTAPTLNLPCFTRKNPPFLTRHSPSSSYIYISMIYIHGCFVCSQS